MATNQRARIERPRAFPSDTTIPSESVLEAIGGLASAARAAVDQLTPWLSPHRFSERLRVGLRLPAAQVEAIAEAPGAEDVRWFMVPGDAVDAEACQRFALDAVVSHAKDALRITTRTSDDRRAAWHDWGIERPITYPNVFPARLDCQGATAAFGERPPSPRLIRALVELAAAHSRLPARLSKLDRAKGRVPILLDAPRGDRFSEVAAPRDRLRRVAENAASALIEHAPSVGSAFALDRLAARVVSAMVATAGNRFDESLRRGACEAAAAIAGDEPAVALRLAAVRVAAGDDEGGIDALLRADRLLRSPGLSLPETNNLPFVHAEMEVESDAVAIGRVAAGIVLLCAPLGVEKIPFLREDLLDDMRFSGLLVGRDPDRAMLHRVFAALEAARRAECRALPSLQSSYRSVAPFTTGAPLKLTQPSRESGEQSSAPQSLRAESGVSGAWHLAPEAVEFSLTTPPVSPASSVIASPVTAAPSTTRLTPIPIRLDTRGLSSTRPKRAKKTGASDAGANAKHAKKRSSGERGSSSTRRAAPKSTPTTSKQGSKPHPSKLHPSKPYSSRLQSNATSPTKPRRSKAA
ncbi:MAG: hypothetical protein SFZ23_09365 [Planctomycetota bacterium]|nr:hypothetical protein [Planctomycetota bacterium]